MPLEVVVAAVLLTVCLTRVVRAPDEDWHDAVLCYLVLVMGWAASNISYITENLNGLPLTDGLMVLYYQFVLLHSPDSIWRRRLYTVSLVGLGLDIPMCLVGEGNMYSVLAVAMYVIFVLQLWILGGCGVGPDDSCDDSGGPCAD